MVGYPFIKHMRRNIRQLLKTVSILLLGNSQVITVNDETSIYVKYAVRRVLNKITTQRCD